MNVGQFSNTSFLKPIVRWEVHGTDFPTLLANQILVTSKITLPVTVSIRDFLPLLTERYEKELWQKARQKFVDLATKFESHR